MIKQIPDCLRKKAMTITNAWYALHMDYWDQIGELKGNFRARFGIDRQLCYEMTIIICDHLEGKNVTGSIGAWIERANLVSEDCPATEELAELRKKLLIEVIDNELYYLQETDRISREDMISSRIEIEGILNRVKHWYLARQNNTLNWAGVSTTNET
ncbi:MAG: hypothetical protein C4550_05720 [Nitrospiraceae bacterium]|nr:MAG: hypothetical protein C4550_05720 [Nitrospiraceae bacterium]